MQIAYTCRWVVGGSPRSIPAPTLGRFGAVRRVAGLVPRARESRSSDGGARVCRDAVVRSRYSQGLPTGRAAVSRADVRGRRVGHFGGRDGTRENFADVSLFGVFKSREGGAGAFARRVPALRPQLVAHRGPQVRPRVSRHQAPLRRRRRARATQAAPQGRFSKSPASFSKKNKKKRPSDGIFSRTRVRTGSLERERVYRWCVLRLGDDFLVFRRFAPPVALESHCVN